MRCECEKNKIFVATGKVHEISTCCVAFRFDPCISRDLCRVWTPHTEVSMATKTLMKVIWMYLPANAVTTTNRQISCLETVSLFDGGVSLEGHVKVETEKVVQGVDFHEPSNVSLGV